MRKKITKYTKKIIGITGLNAKFNIIKSKIRRRAQSKH
jgi:hypothetical protein